MFALLIAGDDSRERAQPPSRVSPVYRVRSGDRCARPAEPAYSAATRPRRDHGPAPFAPSDRFGCDSCSAGSCSDIPVCSWVRSICGRSSPWPAEHVHHCHLRHDPGPAPCGRRPSAGSFGGRPRPRVCRTPCVDRRPEGPKQVPTSVILPQFHPTSGFSLVSAPHLSARLKLSPLLFRVVTEEAAASFNWLESLQPRPTPAFQIPEAAPARPIIARALTGPVDR